MLFIRKHQGNVVFKIWRTVTVAYRKIYIYKTCLNKVCINNGFFVFFVFCSYVVCSGVVEDIRTYFESVQAPFHEEEPLAVEFVKSCMTFLAAITQYLGSRSEQT